MTAGAVFWLFLSPWGCAAAGGDSTAHFLVISGRQPPAGDPPPPACDTPLPAVDAPAPTWDVSAPTSNASTPACNTSPPAFNPLSPANNTPVAAGDLPPPASDALPSAGDTLAPAVTPQNSPVTPQHLPVMPYQSRGRQELPTSNQNGSCKEVRLVWGPALIPREDNKVWETPIRKLCSVGGVNMNSRHLTHMHTSGKQCNSLRRLLTMVAQCLLCAVFM